MIAHLICLTRRVWNPLRLFLSWLLPSLASVVLPRRMGVIITCQTRIRRRRSNVTMARAIIATKLVYFQIHLRNNRLTWSSSESASTSVARSTTISCSKIIYAKCVKILWLRRPSVACRWKQTISTWRESLTVIKKRHIWRCAAVKFSKTSFFSSMTKSRSRTRSERTRLISRPKKTSSISSHLSPVSCLISTDKACQSRGTVICAITWLPKARPLMATLSASMRLPVV